MLFTLIVPVFQTPSILQLFLNSLTDTLEFPSQIIFVNDGSGKEINDMLTSYKNSFENQQKHNKSVCFIIKEGEKNDKTLYNKQKIIK